MRQKLAFRFRSEYNVYASKRSVPYKKINLRSGTEVTMITLKQFDEIDLRVVEIVAAERVASTRKILKLQVQLEDEQRQIIADLAHFYEPEELVGKQAVLIANLQPAIIHGHRSQGKLLVVHGAGEVLTFVTGDRSTSNGAGVR